MAIGVPATGNRTAQGTAQGRRLRRPQRIAALLGFYGIMLIIMGLVADSAQDRARTGDLNANLWAGIAMAVVATGLAVWSRLRPVIMESPDGR